MSNSSKVVHPFFQQQQKKQKVSSPPTPPTPTPSKSTVVSNLSIFQTPKLQPPHAVVPSEPTPLNTPAEPINQPIIETRRTRQSTKPAPPQSKPTPPKLKPKLKPKAKKVKPSPSPPPPITKTTAIEHVPATASCSTLYYVPISKPKFYSDTLEYKAQKQHEAQFNFYGLISHEKRYDHEFSRLDRSIFGHAHVTDRSTLLQDNDNADVFMRQQQPDRNLNMKELIKNRQHEFFQLGKQIRQQQQQKSTPPRGNKKYNVNLTNQGELEAFLDYSFPNWNTFPSCVILSQLVFNKSNDKQVHQQQQWNDKYRPKSVNGLLGERHNYVYLKDWLHQMKIEPMSAPKSTNDQGNGSTKKRNRKKKKNTFVGDELDELTGLSLRDDNEDDDDFMPVKKSAKQLKKESMKSNIILLAGDHGVGKTASVYTAAEQLGYEVFEINSGSRRSGKDIMSMVGEMTKSHLVAFGVPQPLKVTEESKSNANKPRKRKLNPCLSSNNQLTTTDKEQPAGGGGGLLKHFLRKKESVNPPVIKRQQSSEPKQSLILLEEVDLLFEEDKAFWSSIIELSQKSKRPIIMTCNDPDQIPFESLFLQVVLEMKPPPDTELLPYLWLLCFSEGYTVDPADLICLMAFLGRDIRQLIQTLELYVKSDDAIFEKYLGIDRHEPLVDMKLKCIPSRVAVDTFRLARYYEDIDVTTMNDDDDSLDKIEKALEDNAFIDTWLGWKENGNLIQESVKDQINGFTSLWFEDDEESESKLMLTDLESTVSVLNSENISSNVWNNVISDGSSHWDEACDAKSNNFEEYSEAITKLLSLEMIFQPNEQIIMMDYIPYIQQMISASSKARAVKTRSKRKRLYLPLNDDNVSVLTYNRPLIDETEFWINRLYKLKKERP